MNIKFYIIAMLTLVSSITFAQDYKSEIEKTLEEYQTASQQKDAKKVVSFMYPKFFKLIPKEKMEEVLLRQMNDTSTVVTLGDVSILNISDLVKVKREQFLLVKYTFNTSTKFLTQKTLDFDENEVDMVDFAYELQVEMHGTENVTLDKENNTIHTKIIGEMYLISSSKYKGWKVLAKKEMLMSFLEEILPKKVLNSL